MSENYSNKKKAIVITTIHKLNEFIEFYSKVDGWDLIIVADVKTDPLWYKDTNCVFLSLEEQKRISPKLYDLIPFNSYTRKMFGYVYCLQEKYDIIYDTDDDNINTELLSNKQDQSLIGYSNNKLINAYSFYTDIIYDTKNVLYPRGFPIQYANNLYDVVDTKNKQFDVAIIQGLVNGDPDIDAKCRIPLDNCNFNFTKNLNTNLLLGRGNYCPFNSQNTFWLDSSMFYNLYLPTTVNFRYTDILRGYVSLHQLHKNDKYLKFTPPTALQKRNSHNLHKDLLDEIEMYDSVLNVVDILVTNPFYSIRDVYADLCEKKIVTQHEILTLNTFLEETNSN